MAYEEDYDDIMYKRPFMYKIFCKVCDNYMRYDAEYFSQTNLLLWHCWKCGFGIKTSNLSECFIERLPNLNEGEEE